MRLVPEVSGQMGVVGLSIEMGCRRRAFHCDSTNRGGRRDDVSPMGGGQQITLGFTLGYTSPGKSSEEYIRNPDSQASLFLVLVITEVRAKCNGYF